MPTGHAFNSLGQIFAAGGDSTLILSASEGIGGLALLALIGSKYPKLSQSDRQRLATHVEQAVNAGASVNVESGDIESPLIANFDEVPQDFSLFGEEPAGRRIRVTLEIQAGDNAKPFMAKLDFATMPNLDELFEKAAKFIERFIREYPEAAARLGLHALEEIAFDVIGIQRSY